MDKREAFVRFYIIKNLICNIEIEKKKQKQKKKKQKGKDSIHLGPVISVRKKLILKLNKI